MQQLTVTGQVLTTGGVQRKTLAAGKLLNRRGLRVTVGESTLSAPTLWSGRTIS